KLFSTMQLLRARQAQADVFQSGGYEPLAISGLRAPHVFAFRRRLENRQVIVAVPRLIARLSPDGHPPLGEHAWADTEIHLPGPVPAHLRDRFTGRCVAVSAADAGARVRAAELFAAFPIAVLEHSAVDSPSE